MRHRGHRGGFTFVEVLVVIALLVSMAGLAIPFYQSFQIGSQLDNVTQEISQTLRRAQFRAMASDGLTAWGVHFEVGSFTLFKGAVYTADDSYNERVDYSSAITVSPAMGSDIVFDAVSGETTGAGAVTVDASSGSSRTIVINDLGVVDVQ